MSDVEIRCAGEEASCYSLKLTLGSQVAPPSIIVGSHVWVEDPDEAWTDGDVTEVKGDEIQVSTTSGKTVSALSLDFL
ncbi:hypothetical protein V6N11_036744 [Hibiscus sabdariffa]|uniref:Myosin N-terminal SH3-like domain-containing protein n=1 Tax=Hibiscus sabdariffa TaxID=183260 RepID=A0ABR2RBA0_9ROSI